MFIRSKLHVEKHMGELGVKCVQRGQLGLLTWGQFSGLSRASHLACAHFSPDSGFFLMGMHLSAKVDSGAKVSGGLAGHLLGWHLLPPLSSLD